MGDGIKVRSTHRIYLKEGGETDAHLRRVVMAGLRSLGFVVADDANIGIDQPSGGGMASVVVTWSEDITP